MPGIYDESNAAQDVGVASAEESPQQESSSPCGAVFKANSNTRSHYPTPKRQRQACERPRWPRGDLACALTFER